MEEERKCLCGLQDATDLGLIPGETLSSCKTDQTNRRSPVF